MGLEKVAFPGMVLGVNGLGRIGKLTLWHFIARKSFDHIVVNTGRELGGSIRDVVHYIERDSTYGLLHTFLYGCNAKPVIESIDEAENTITIDGIRVKLLTEARNPAAIDWTGEGVRLVIETTGQFLDPTAPADSGKGSCLGHLEAGAEKVVVSAPFKIKDKGKSMPEDAVTTVMGINDRDYDPRIHKIVSAASCTTTCLAHMIAPLLKYFGPKRILTASMATIHAATGSQAVLDRAPKTGAADLRKSRSIMDNIILTTTGAAKTLSLVIPEMKQIGFMAESVRIPTSTGSLVILNMTFQDDKSGTEIRRDLLNGIYKKASDEDKNGYLIYSDSQNVSRDIIGAPRAAAIIEGHETHTRTAEVAIDLTSALGSHPRLLEQIEDNRLNVPVTQAVIYGWYDNEYGSYVNLLGDRTVSIAETMLG